MGSRADIYRRVVLERPRLALCFLALFLAFFAFHTRNFDLDASAESLLLEDDPDLRRFRETAARYETRELLIVTFTPASGELFSDDSLARLGALRDDLATVGSVYSVTTLLDVPLLDSSDVPLLEMTENLQTLEKPTIDRDRARTELLESPVFRDLIISRDARTTGLLLELSPDEELSRIQAERTPLLNRRSERPLTPEEDAALGRLTSAYRAAGERVDGARHAEIAEIRGWLARHSDGVKLHLGGIPMIADDMITFVRNDLVVFGSGVLVFLGIMLAVIFRQVRWVVLPLSSCFYAGTTMIGLLGLVGWPVTVISSNFLALMLIITISMNIHLAVRYRELLAATPNATQVELVTQTVGRMVWPCFYTALTTIIGFTSLVFSNIKPVQDFGWMMSAGLAVAFLTSFTLFPALLVSLKKRPSAVRSDTLPFVNALASLTVRHGTTVLVGSAVLAVVGLIGISQLTVENAFIDYFREDTEIYQGTRLIDRELGGTTPLDVLISFEPEPEPEPEPEIAADDDDLDDWLTDEIDVAAGPAYWFTPYKVSKIKRVHDYLEGLPEVGKVLSLASVIRVAEALNDGEPFDGVELSLLYSKLPPEIRGPLIDPYVSIADNEARIQLRIRDSEPGLRRAELLDRIRAGLVDPVGLDEREVSITGTLLLYNNMLQSLYRSQIASLGAVLAGIALMLMVLFRSWRLALISIAPQLLAAGLVLGLMGLVGIPLDMMTITIAAITIGIAVDDAIHYIYRFREELPEIGDYAETVRRCHATIGTAVFYTSATVIFGFSILSLSNFLPTIYFGALTGLAMFVALGGVLTLLPRLILIAKPFAVEARVLPAPNVPEAKSA